MILRASSPVVWIDIECTRDVMTSSTFVLFGSLPSSTTRNMTSRSLKIPATRFSSTTSTLPTLAEAISSTASMTVVVLDTVKTDLLTMAIAFRPFSVAQAYRKSPTGEIQSDTASNMELMLQYASWRLNMPRKYGKSAQKSVERAMHKRK